VQQIRELAATAAAPSDFQARLLERVVEATGALAGVVWVPAKEGRLNAMAELRLAETGLRNNVQLRAWCEPAIREVLANGGVRRQPGRPAEGPAGAHWGPMLLFALQRGTQVLAVVHLFEDPKGAPADQLAQLRFVETVMQIAAEYLERTLPAAAPAARRQDVQALLLALHRSLNLRDVATIAANDLRQWYLADRVGIAQRVGNRAVLRAVSGQEQLNQKSNVLKLLTRLAAEVIRSGEPFVFDGNPSVVPASLERPLADYLHEGQARWLAIFPLREPEPPAENHRDGAALAARPGVVGAIVIEQFSEAGWAPDLLIRVEETAPHLALALANASHHERVFLMPLFDLLGRWRAALRGRRLATAAVLAVVLAGAVAALWLIKADYRVEAA